nr:MAG TPA: hypothetical protein [Caudoviricetes sp.]
MGLYLPCLPPSFLFLLHITLLLVRFRSLHNAENATNSTVDDVSVHPTTAW